MTDQGTQRFDAIGGGKLYTLIYLRPISDRRFITKSKSLSPSTATTSELKRVQDD